MKLLKITTCYPSYLRNLYAQHAGLAGKPFAEQLAALEYDAFGWPGCWAAGLNTLGYDAREITMNVEPLQRAWALENGVPDPHTAELNDILLAQVKQFKPDVLWFDDLDGELLKRIRAEEPSIRLVLGWVGSAVPKSDVWPHMDLILSCAPEAVTLFQDRGLRAAHLDHGFDPKVNARLRQDRTKSGISFIGQLMRVSQFHLQREHLLEQLVEQTGIAIYSPSAAFCWKHDVEALLLAGAYPLVKTAKAVGIPDSVFKPLPLFRRAIQLSALPKRPVNPKLKAHLKPAVFGLEMFQVLRDSQVTLNIHADSSPLYASNMRLFETTGVGTCMLTDWKQNLHELFEIDKEVVAYKSAEECVEKAKWLLDHPREREEIAQAGMARTLRDYTFEHRAATLDQIIRKELR